MEIFLACAIGALFGFALNRVGATNPENIINMLRLTDLRLMKAILLAIGVSCIALFGGMALQIIDPSHISIKSAYIGVIVGGGILGAGFAIAGYCPGTGLTALATGRKDALVFVVGGLIGAFVYTCVYKWLSEETQILDAIAGGKVSLAQTGNQKFEALIPTIDGTVVGIGLGAVCVIIAFVLPYKILKEK